MEGTSKGKNVIEDDDEISDLAKVYNAPFPLKTHEEGKRYTILDSKNISTCKYFQDEILNYLGIKDDIIIYVVDQDGLNLSFHHLTLIKKLLHLIDKSEKKLEFRLFGEDYHVNYD